MDKHSQAFFETSLKFVPGGVHSPVRSFKGLHTTPIFFERAQGAYLYDTDEKSYIDFCMSFGPLILGHRNQQVLEDIKRAVEKGWSFGACERYSLELAQFLVDHIKPIEQVRFVNSGTEAVMTALRLARGATGRDKIIKFNGCYHGHTDSMLIKAGSGVATQSEASSKGVPKGISSDTIVLELADLEAVRNAFDQFKNQIAAIIIEPLPANNGLLIQDKEFLQGLRNLSQKEGSLLIFDEVISGFRTGLGGMSEKLGISPDIITYGKIIGGGLPVGAICSTKEIMQHLAPVGEVYQAGTLSANPLAMVAGLSTLKQLHQDVYTKLESQTQKITTLFSDWFKKNTFDDLNMISFESLFWIHPGFFRVQKTPEVPQNLIERFNPLFEKLLNKGIYLSPNGYEVGFVSLAHDDTLLADLKDRLNV